MAQKNWEDDSISTDDEITAEEWVDMANTIEANETHKTSDGTDHTYIDQDVTTTGNPFFVSVGFDYAEGTVSAEGTLGSSFTFDWNSGSHFTGTLDSDVSIDFSNASAGQKKTLLLSYDDSSQRSITWTPTIKWFGGSTPDTPSTSGEVLVVTVFFDGSTYYGNGGLAS